MSLFAHVGVITSAIKKTGWPYVLAPDPRGDGSLSVIEFSRCPSCNGAAGSKLGVYANGATDFVCGGCEMRSADEVLLLFGLDFSRSLRPSISPVDYADFRQQFAVDRPVQIEGLMRQGDIVNLNGGSKARKTLLAAQWVLTFVTGGRFLGLYQMHRPKGRALIVDYELHQDAIRRRIDSMMSAMNLPADVGRRFQFCAMRGDNYADIQQVCDWLDSLPPETYSLVVVDALYRSVPDGHDENSNPAVTRLYNRLDKTAAKHRCSFLVLHHFSKGSQSDKATADLGAGAGAQSRAADCHLAIREHAKENHVILSGIVRDFPPLDDVVLTCDWPLWRHAPDVDPADTSQHAKCDCGEVAALLNTEPTEERHFPAYAAARLGVSQAAAKKLLGEAVKAGLVTKEKGKGGNPTMIHVTEEQAHKIAVRLNEINNKETA